MIERAVLVVAVEEGACGHQQGFVGCEELTVGDFTLEMGPQHRNRVEPAAVGLQMQRYERQPASASRCSASSISRRTRTTIPKRSSRSTAPCTSRPPSVGQGTCYQKSFLVVTDPAECVSFLYHPPL